MIDCPKQSHISTPVEPHGLLFMSKCLLSAFSFCQSRRGKMFSDFYYVILLLLFVVGFVVLPMRQNSDNICFVLPESFVCLFV